MNENWADTDFFNYMKFACNWIEGAEVKVKFLESYFKNNLNVDDIENSFIVLDKMRTKTFFYLIMSVLIEYELQRKGIDKRKEEKEEDSNLYYLHAGKVDTSRLDLDGKDINFYNSDLEDIGVDLGKDSLIVFPFRDTMKVLDYINQVLTYLEQKDNDIPKN